MFPGERSPRSVPCGWSGPCLSQDGGLASQPGKGSYTLPSALWPHCSSPGGAALALVALLSAHTFVNTPFVYPFSTYPALSMPGFQLGP